MEVTYAVITNIPDIKGNLCNAILYKDDGEMFVEAMSLNACTTGHSTGPLVENFELGEILVLDSDTEREVAGCQRKPSKWRVEVEKFATIEDAIKRAIEVSS